MGWRERRISREAAMALIAKRFREWIVEHVSVG
jgi:hypothetical protein